jgi:hypothetical protein
MTVQEKLQRLREVGYELNIKEVLIEGWAMFKVQPLRHITFMFTLMTLQLFTLKYAPYLNAAVNIFLAPVLFSSFYMVANAISRKETINYSTYFTSFRYYLPIIFIWILCQVIFVIGLFALIFPAIYLLVAYGFSVLMSIFGGFDVWQAMEESRKLITVRWWQFFKLTLILMALNVLGALLNGLGLPFTIPFTFFVFYIAFEKITKEVFS